VSLEPIIKRIEDVLHSDTGPENEAVIWLVVLDGFRDIETRLKALENPEAKTIPAGS
jgi:hypothetical protein